MGIRIWILSTAYVLAVSLAVSYVFFAGLSAIPLGGVSLGVVFICLAAAVCYVATAVFFAYAPKRIFPGLSRPALSESLAALPKLLAILGFFTLGFAAVSGLLSLLIFYVLSAGLPEMERRTPVMAGVVIVLLLSLPFFARAFAGFAAGEAETGGLFRGSLRMGGPLYSKYLILSAIAFGLALLIRVFLGSPGSLSGALATLVLTSAVFGAAIPVSWVLYRQDRLRRGRAERDPASAFPKPGRVA